jgi:hypothetical protein
VSIVSNHYPELVEELNQGPAWQEDWDRPRAARISDNLAELPQQDQQHHAQRNEL